MKVAILAGGLGSRLAEETELKPKPMVEIGGRPILWHIAKHYAHYGYNEFLIALGYRGELIKRYFLDYQTLSGSMAIDLSNGTVQSYDKDCEGWKLHLMDTGFETNTGGRLKRLEPFLGKETFMLTYGDGLSSLDLSRLLNFHRSHGRTATVTAVRPPPRFGGLVFEGDIVVASTEKPQIREGWINGGFMLFKPPISHYLKPNAPTPD